MLLLSMHHRADEKLCIFAPVQAGHEGWSHGLRGYEPTNRKFVEYSAFRLQTTTEGGIESFA